MAKSTELAADLQSLAPLLGTWTSASNSPTDKSSSISGQVTIEPLSGGHFLIQRSTVENPDFPDSISIIGADEKTGNFKFNYFDSRGVARVYAMTLQNNTWTLSRDDPDFAQRFIGTLSPDNNTITARWERADDHINWEHDFDITYTRVK